MSRYRQANWARPRCPAGVSRLPAPDRSSDGHDRRAAAFESPRRAAASLKPLPASGKAGGWGHGSCRQDKQTAGQVGISRGSICSLSRSRSSRPSSFKGDGSAESAAPRGPGGRQSSHRGGRSSRSDNRWKPGDRARSSSCSVGADRRASRKHLWRSRLSNLAALLRLQGRLREPGCRASSTFEIQGRCLGRILRSPAAVAPATCRALPSAQGAVSRSAPAMASSRCSRKLPDINRRAASSPG